MVAGVVNLTVPVCDLCLSGAEGECHWPGCVFWMCAAPTAEQAEALRDHAFVEIVKANPEAFEAAE